jgi:hypothetical protein
MMQRAQPLHEGRGRLAATAGDLLGGLMAVCGVTEQQGQRHSQADGFHAHDLSVKRKEPLALKYEGRVNLVGVHAHSEQAPRADHLAQADGAIVEESTRRPAARAADGTHADLGLV